MQSYNPNNPVYKYKSIKTDIPKTSYNEENIVGKDDSGIPNSYGLYLQPTQFKNPTMKSTTFLHYI
jgi:hypothetical protein